MTTIDTLDGDAEAVGGEEVVGALAVEVEVFVIERLEVRLSRQPTISGAVHHSKCLPLAVVTTTTSTNEHSVT